MIKSLSETALIMSVIGAAWMVLAVSCGRIKTATVEKVFMLRKGGLSHYRNRR